MAVKRYNPEGVAKPVAYYSHVAEAPAGSKVVALAGQVGNRLDGSFPESMEEQLEVALENVLTLASAAGKGEADVLKIIAFVVDPPTDGPRVAGAFAKAFPSGYPPLTWIYVKALFRPHVKVELDVTLAV